MFFVFFKLVNKQRGCKTLVLSNRKYYFYVEGDDCISIVSGSQNVQAVNINCGPGHGIRFHIQTSNNHTDIQFK